MDHPRCSGRTASICSGRATRPYAPGTAEPGSYGVECWCANCCEGGHICAEQAEVGSGCDADYCCTELCPVGDPDFMCAGADQGCVPLFDPMDPEYSHVGQCMALP